MTVASAKKGIQQCGDHPSGIFNTNNYVCSGWGVSKYFLELEFEVRNSSAFNRIFLGFFKKRILQTLFDYVPTLFQINLEISPTSAVWKLWNVEPETRIINWFYWGNWTFPLAQSLLVDIDFFGDTLFCASREEN